MIKDTYVTFLKVVRFSIVTLPSFPLHCTGIQYSGVVSEGFWYTVFSVANLHNVKICIIEMGNQYQFKGHRSPCKFTVEQNHYFLAGY